MYIYLDDISLQLFVIFLITWFISVGKLFISVARQPNMTPVKEVRSRYDTYRSKCYYGNSNVKARLYSLSFDIYNMYLFSVTI